MYQYTEFDRQFVTLRAQQFRDQLERWQRGELTDEQLLPLRLQNGWYIQRYAPMARIAVPYGEISSTSCACWPASRATTTSPTPELLAHAQATQTRCRPRSPVPRCSLHRCVRLRPLHHAHQRAVQLDSDHQGRRRDGPAGQRVNMHGIQTSGNDIRNITCDALEGIAEDGIVDCRPFAEITRQWSTLHPEFSFLPRKFKIAFNGAKPKTAPPPAGTTSACRR
jgi:sulfite reductase (NADPH) hemoprotein beta-component